MNNLGDSLQKQKLLKQNSINIVNAIEQTKNILITEKQQFEQERNIFYTLRTNLMNEKEDFSKNTNTFNQVTNTEKEEFEQVKNQFIKEKEEFEQVKNQFIKEKEEFEQVKNQFIKEKEEFSKQIQIFEPINVSEPSNVVKQNRSKFMFH
jgi:hypothetical protein